MRMVVSFRGGLLTALILFDERAASAVNAPGPQGTASAIMVLTDEPVMPRQRPAVERRGPFASTLLRYPGKGGWTFAPIPKKLAPPVTRPWGRTPVRAVVDGVSWDTSIWRDTKTNGALLAVPARIRGRKGSGDSVTVEFTFDADEDE